MWHPKGHTEALEQEHHHHLVGHHGDQLRQHRIDMGLTAEPQGLRRHGSVIVADGTLEGHAEDPSPLHGSHYHGAYEPAVLYDGKKQEKMAWGTIGSNAIAQPVDDKPRSVYISRPCSSRALARTQLSDRLIGGKWVYPDQLDRASWGNHSKPNQTDIHGFEGPHDHRVTNHGEIPPCPHHYREV